MSDNEKTFYITTPIYYVNAEPHIGHAYTQIAADVIARYRRMLGEEVFFLTGTDEHGSKIEQAARAAGFAAGDEKNFVDRIVERFKNAWERLEISYDHFIRTTDPEHSEEVGRMLLAMKEKGDIYEGEYDGWYCTPCETFWTEKEAPDNNCPSCGRALEKITEKNYFFKMSRYRDWLVDHIRNNELFCRPDYRRNEVLGFLQEELTDLCISRPKSRMSWGVELPFDKDYVVYVWFDALINYLTAIRSTGRGFEKVWPADLHLIAKDILRHHAVYWPIMLKSAGIAPPSSVFAHGWWKMGEEKMSKSKGNIVDPLVLADSYGVDAVRYFLLRAIEMGADGTFTEDLMRSTYNTDLANDLGNLLNRTLTMVEKYFEGRLPEAPGACSEKQLALSDTVREAVIPMAAAVHQAFTSPELRIKEALEEVMRVVDVANKYIERSAPWEHAKRGDTDALKLIMCDLMEVLRSVTLALAPVMPGAMRDMWRQLGYEGDPAQNFDSEELNRSQDNSCWRKVKAGLEVKKSDVLFPRL